MYEKTEKEKMLAGEMFNCLDPILNAEREEIRKIVTRFNQEEDFSARQVILRELLGEMGQNTVIDPPFYCVYGKNIFLGEQVFLNRLCNILDSNEVHIGSRTMIGPGVQIYTGAHELQVKLRNQGYEVARPIVIEEDVWIGGSAILLPGVRIGRGAVVGAGTVVTRDVPTNTIVGGNPARVIREIEQE